MAEVEELAEGNILTFQGYLKKILRITTVSALLGITYGDYHELSEYKPVLEVARLTFKGMEDVAKRERKGPRFVFTHLYQPHNPFIFDKDGNLKQQRYLFEEPCCPPVKTFNIDGQKVEWRIDRRDYTEQAQYVNKRLLKFVDDIKKNTDRPFIIIIQADHGPQSVLDWDNPSNEGYKERFSIMNAVYVSDGNDKAFKSDMRPVNTFRNVFNTYFGYDFPMLDFKSYYSSYADPYAFSDVTPIILEEEK